MGRRVIASSLFVAACGPVVGADDDGSTTTDATTATTTTTTADPTSTDPSSSDPSNPTSLSTSGNPTTASDPATTDTVSTTVDPSDTTGVIDPCGDFVCPPDFEIGPPPCDLWAQDCFRGYKCVPWANDGGDRWNDSGCFPLDPTPAQPGDPCTVEGGPTTGIDDCDIGSMCFFVDPESNQGTCVALCMGNENNPLCEDPSTSCAIELDGVLAACLPACDPLLEECAQGACYATSDGEAFVCAQTLGIGLGAGQTCGHEWECARGYACYDGAHVPDCAGDRCCTPLCDVTVPGQCEELTCDHWFPFPPQPVNPPDTGVCILE